MTGKTNRHPLTDAALDGAEGGGVFQTPAGGWGDRWTGSGDAVPGYIGETEKNVRTATAGTRLTHDPVFEEWAKKR